MGIVECESCGGRRYVEDNCTTIYACHRCGKPMRPLKEKTEPVAEVPCSVGLVDVEVKEEKTLSGWVQPYVCLRIGNFEFKRNYQTERGAENCVNKIREMLKPEQGN